MARKNLQNFDEIKARLLQFAETQGIAKGQFYEKISMFPSNFAGKGAESALKSDNIVKVLTEFPDLNSDWLLLGRGEMLRSATQSVGNISHSTAVGVNVNGNDINISNNTQQLVDTIARQAETIARQAAIIDRLTTPQ